MPATAKEDKSKSIKKTTATTAAKKSSPKRKKSKVKKDLVIVESPAKAHTIEKYLGRKYRVPTPMYDKAAAKLGYTWEGEL